MTGRIFPIHWIIFLIANVFLGVGALHGCASVFCVKVVGILVLAGLAPSYQLVGSLFRPPRPPESSENVSLMGKSLNYFPSTTFAKIWQTFLLPQLTSWCSKLVRLSLLITSTLFWVFKKFHFCQAVKSDRKTSHSLFMKVSYNHYELLTNKWLVKCL
jgi:hypothetical protein